MSNEVGSGRSNMDEPRDVRTFRRNAGCGSSASTGSALAMEIRRKKVRQSTVFQQTEDTDIQRKLDFEMRMRDGAYKLLLACSKREQLLNASKNLLTCNARIKAYLTQLQHREEEQDGRLSDPVSDERVPCAGKVAISGLRIPLMWKDSDHFNNRGSSRRAAVFCLMQAGSQVFDTDMVVVDRSATDVCFEGAAVFGDALPQFELRVELWSCAVDEETVLAHTPKKLAKKLRSSLGKAAGKKYCPPVDTSDPDTFLHSHPVPPGTRYSLLAYTTLSLFEAEGSFQSHSLMVLQDADWSSWLPLYGNLCCRLAAQPDCMTQHTMAGFLNQQQSVQGMPRCCSLYCVLSGGFLSCYFTPEEIRAKVEPGQKIPVNKDTRVRVTERDPAGRRSNSLTIINPSSGGAQSLVFATDTREELEEWLEAVHQHLYDQSQWLHCCERLMEIEAASPRKRPLFLAKQADSVYNDLSINSPGKLESLTDIIHSKVEETDGRFLIGPPAEREVPNWSTLFDGSHSVVVHKSVLSPARSPAPRPSPGPDSAKKRRAPPPPADRHPYAPPSARPSRPPPPAPLLHPPPVSQREKENEGVRASRPAARSKTGRPSLDAKFSAIIQQLQKNGSGGRRNAAPLGHLEVQHHAPPPPQIQEPEIQNRQARTPDGAFRGFGPVPAPRSKLRKSFREKINPKAW